VLTFYLYGICCWPRAWYESYCTNLHGFGKTRPRVELSTHQHRRGRTCHGLVFTVITKNSALEPWTLSWTLPAAASCCGSNQRVNDQAIKTARQQYTNLHTSLRGLIGERDKLRHMVIYFKLIISTFTDTYCTCEYTSSHVVT